MQIQPSIFKTYDIRGIYGQDFDETLAYDLGLAYTNWRSRELSTNNLSVVIGHDMRLSSPELHQALSRGLLDGGAEIIDIGLCATPSFYFAVANERADGGLMITASHNPKDYNGFKIVRDRARPVSENTGLTELKDLVLNRKFTPAKQPGTILKIDNILEQHIAYESTIAGFQPLKPFKIVADPANGMGGPYIEKLLALYTNISLIRMNWPLDGSFPNHESDPLKPENLEPLCQMVLGQQADLGIATDGDADRIFFVDNLGQPIEPGILRALMAKIFLAERPGAIIAYDIRPGKITPETIIASGGQPLVTKVGHSLIKEAMLESGAYFAAESSGHFFLNMEHGCYEVPGVIMIKLLQALSQSRETLADFIKPYKKYYHSGEINRRVNDPAAKIKLIAERYSDGQLDYLDGLTVTYPDFWFNVRPSNTEPLLRFSLEAKTPEIMAVKRDEVLQLLTD